MLNSQFIPVDIDQEIALRLNLLKVSGVIPSIDARYCKGTLLNNSLCDASNFWYRSSADIDKNEKTRSSRVIKHFAINCFSR